MLFRTALEGKRMSPVSLILGCSIFLAAFGGLVASCLVVDAAIPPKVARETRPAPQPAAAETESEPASDLADSGESPHRARSESPRLSGRWCVNLDGNAFGWNWPNVPFGAIACGDASRK